MATEISLTLIVCYSTEHSSRSSTDLQSSHFVNLSFLCLCPVNSTVLGPLVYQDSILSSQLIPPLRDHCSLFCHNQYLPKNYFIYFKHCYRWKSKSHSYSFVFTRCRNFLVFIQPPLQYTKDILAFQFYPARTTFGSRFKSTNMLESLPVP